MVSHVKLKNDWREYYYAHTNKSTVNNHKSMLLHRFIMNAPPDKMVDHIDLDTLNTRKYNLRLCDRNQNMCHSRGRSDNTSGTKGVFKMEYPTGRVRYRAFIMVNRKYINLGEFVERDDAIKCRKDGELKYFGEFQPVEEDAS